MIVVIANASTYIWMGKLCASHMYPSCKARSKTRKRFRISGALSYPTMKKGTTPIKTNVPVYTLAVEPS